MQYISWIMTEACAFSCFVVFLSLAHTYDCPSVNERNLKNIGENFLSDRLTLKCRQISPDVLVHFKRHYLYSKEFSEIIDILKIMTENVANSVPAVALVLGPNPGLYTGPTLERLMTIS